MNPLFYYVFMTVLFIGIAEIVNVILFYKTWKKQFWYILWISLPIGIFIAAKMAGDL